MRYFLLICYVLVLVACNNESTTATAKDSASTSVKVQTDTAAAAVTPSCYALQTSNNLILLKLDDVSPKVSGHLTYAIMGKDKNDGTISGAMRGDTLFAFYNFMSEGKLSVRQVAFLRKGNAFVEGYGDVKQKGDTVLFSRSDTLDFNGTMILTQVPCIQP